MVNKPTHLKAIPCSLAKASISSSLPLVVRTINEHLKNIFESDELQQDSTIRKFRVVQTEGKRKVEREIEFDHLDAINAVGYRVNSYQATRFRIWATQTLKEYIVKGFVMDDNRLKQGTLY
jgi:hypothetical protein